MKSQQLFSEKEKKAIVNAIKAAELNTSGEIRVHIEAHCKEKNVLDRAANVFTVLEMHKTELRNGVLFYLATADRKFAIIGDAGINKKVPNDFWKCIKDGMASKFRDGLFTDGLAEGILLAGEQLKTHFPRANDDVNELPDEISFGDLNE
jgi:Predicted membrane protein